MAGKRMRVLALIGVVLLLVMPFIAPSVGATTYSYQVSPLTFATVGTFATTGNLGTVDWRNATLTEAVSGGGFYAEGLLTVQRTTLSTNAFTANTWNAIFLIRGSTSGENMSLSVMNCGTGLWTLIHVFTASISVLTWNATSSFETCGSSVSWLVNSSNSTPDIAADVLYLDQGIVDFRLYVLPSPADNTTISLILLSVLFVAFSVFGTIARLSFATILGGFCGIILAVVLIPLASSFLILALSLASLAFGIMFVMKGIALIGGD